MGGIQIAVCGAGESTPETDRLAEEVGREIARAGASLISGGLGGVMRAASRGAKSAGGRTVGILPGVRPCEANEYIDVAIASGLGQGRNLLVVQSADAVIAIAGEYGTLSEIALALKIGRPVVGLRTWEVSDRVIRASEPKEAVETALRLAGKPS